jgi:hypothetical protein
MPASKHGDVQTDKYDGRKFITMRVSSNGEPSYRKLYLRTKDHPTARRRARAIEHLDDVDEARKVIRYIASSRTPEMERRRIAEVARLGPLIPSLDHETARAELESIVCEFLEYEPGEIDDEIVDAWMRTGVPEEQRQILLDLDVPADWLAETPSIFTDLKSRGWKVNTDDPRWREGLEELLKLPHGTLKCDRAAYGPRLSACIDEFRTEQEQRDNQPRHTNAYIRRFKAFVDFLKDPHVKHLKKADFVKFVDHVLRQKKGRSNKTIQDHLQTVKAVFESARARMDDDVFPESLDNWFRVLDRERRKRPYKPPRHNREPVPPDLFRKLLAQADEWAELDVDVYAAALPVPRTKYRRKRALVLNRNKRHARSLRRTGLMTHSMLCLAANVGAGASDFARLRWDELVLRGKLPLYMEDRQKPAHLLGSEVPRCCPLLPETVRSLKRWRAWQQAELNAAGQARRGAPQNGEDPKGNTRRAGRRGKCAPETGDFAFTYEDGRPLNQSTTFGATKYVRLLRRAAKCPPKWQLRHCRKIGATLCRDAHLPTDMAIAWLGQSARGTNKFYTGEAKDDYLLPLVRAIRNTYFR